MDSSFQYANNIMQAMASARRTVTEIDTVS